MTKSNPAAVSVPTLSSPLVGRPSRKRRPLFFAVALIAVGALLVGNAGYIHVKAWLAQRLMERSWQAMVLDGSELPPWPWADTHAVARLQSSRHEVDLVVLAGASMRNLAFGPVLHGGAGLAHSPEWIISGHRDTHFAFLADVEPGDEVAVVLPDGLKRRFVVDATEVVNVRSQSLAVEASERAIYLVTCYPLTGALSDPDRRFVVRASAMP